MVKSVALETYTVALRSCSCLLQLSLQELRDAVVKIYENRRNLAATLTDTKNVVANLERVMTAVVQFILFFAYLAIWKVLTP